MTSKLLMNKGNYRKLGSNWVSRFLSRHSELRSRFSQSLDRDRAETYLMIQKSWYDGFSLWNRLFRSIVFSRKMCTIWTRKNSQLRLLKDSELFVTNLTCRYIKLRIKIESGCSWLSVSQRMKDFWDYLLSSKRSVKWRRDMMSWRTRILILLWARIAGQTMF